MTAKTWLNTRPHHPMAALRQWHQAVGEKKFIERDAAGRDELIALRFALITEEAQEVLEALLNYAKTKIMDDHFEAHPEATITGLHVVEAPRRYEALAKELADLLYVVYGTADLLEIPLEAVFAEVHRSNMSKVGPAGEVIRREDGKILKPDTYREADVHGAITGEWL
ncbi:putative HAD superfamily Cof-like phosphohydrolase [Streptomyces sp. BK022]|uniref:MazG nucleotide pyrophosphohydrolase domain-containing protein n=1 Tax=Streptomyces sp. BK022 TaxID=2512123 RepID=UPI00102983F5|nr:MazG nucleotide pyrophosphohydrolase domain-containing protein [Streptomyces sp. BK022]RZU36046.1 putative HAD superfamily Cof-like phosphohydrolase [Streptomyces sp. BK022]